MTERQTKHAPTSQSNEMRPAAIDADQLPDSVDYGEDVSMGPGAVLPGQPRLHRSASKMVEPEAEEEGA